MATNTTTPRKVTRRQFEDISWKLSHLKHLALLDQESNAICLAQAVMEGELENARTLAQATIKTDARLDTIRTQIMRLEIVE